MKGLEYDSVKLAESFDEIVPKGLGSEESGMLYVAMTRAKSDLELNAWMTTFIFEQFGTHWCATLLCLLRFKSCDDVRMQVLTHRQHERNCRLLDLLKYLSSRSHRLLNSSSLPSFTRSRSLVRRASLLCLENLAFRLSHLH